MNVMQKMHRDYYETIENDIKARPVVMETIEKVINCGNPSYGGAMYGRPHCGNLIFVPFNAILNFSLLGEQSILMIGLLLYPLN